MLLFLLGWIHTAQSLQSGSGYYYKFLFVTKIGIYKFYVKEIILRLIL